MLRCVRPDGSVTGQKQEGAHAGFFPGHDLTHFAVETELGSTMACYGLIASGWDIDDTTGKGSRGPLPPDRKGKDARSYWPAGASCRRGKRST